VEESAVDNGVDGQAETAKVKDVRDFEPRGQPALRGFLPRPDDRRRCDIDTGDRRRG